MSLLTVNLNHSRKACNYVIKTLSEGGANWDQYQNSSSSWEYCVQTYGEAACRSKKDPVDICLYDKLRPSYLRKIRSLKTMLEKIQLMADESENFKCGNCGEFAFMYLYDDNVRPIDWMALVGADHAFVVIGRDKNSTANNILSWGGSAAICDPWGQGFRSNDAKTGTYPASAFKVQMGGLVKYTGVKSLHREA